MQMVTNQIFLQLVPKKLFSVHFISQKNNEEKKYTDEKANYHPSPAYCD